MSSRPAGDHAAPAQARRVLLADRDDRRRTRFQLFFDRRGYEATAASGLPATDAGATPGYDVVFCDVETAARIDRRALGDPYVVLVAAASERERAIETLEVEPALDDCVLEPAADVDLALVLRRAERWGRFRQRRFPRQKAARGAAGFAGMVGDSPAMAQVFDLVTRVADHDANVLITGDSGTGKELVARAIHDRSAREGRFVAVNCGAIPSSLLESELFGYRKGAFTDAQRDKRGLVEEAHGGTLFLDEIGEMSEGLQVVLLRLLQEAEIRPLGSNQPVHVDVRVVAATVRDLAGEVSAGRFRQDLYFRLNVLPINVPSLRERKEDIPALAHHFLRVFAERHGLDPNAVAIADDALAHLERHDWPGNVRELENSIERALVLAEGGRVDAAALGDLAPQARLQPEAPHRASSELSIKRATRAVEEELIRRALETTGGNRTNAAKLLEISHRALLYKIREYGIS